VSSSFLLSQGLTAFLRRATVIVELRVFCLVRLNCLFEKNNVRPFRLVRLDCLFEESQSVDHIVKESGPLSQNY
jgi:hypothetical protein